MKGNPILEEIWRVKDSLACEAGYNVDLYCEQLRDWSEAYRYDGPVAHSAEELRNLLMNEQGQGFKDSALTLKDELPPPKS